METLVRPGRLGSSLDTLVRQTKELFDFYRHGAAVAPPEREADKSHWYHRALVVAHVAASAYVGKMIFVCAVASLPFALTAAAFVYLGHKAADAVHGLVHFTFDNYFDRATPLVGTVVDGFLSHHDRPAMITRIQLAQNVAPLVMISLPVLLGLILIYPVGTLAGVATSSFVGTLFVEAGFSMEPHKYAHISQDALPSALRWLQQRGWLISPEMHAKHHARRPGFEADYAVMTGKSNRYLTAAFLRRIERAIYEITKGLTGVGVEPRSWCDEAVRRSAFP